MLCCVLPKACLPIHTVTVPVAQRRQHCLQHVCWLLQSMPVGTHDRPQRRWVIDDWSLRIDHECFLPPDSTHLGRLQTPSASGAGCSCNQVLDPRTIPEYIFLGLAVLATTGLHLAHEPRVHRLLVIAQWELPALSGL